jgi:predicted negative regulator of RcsB-dependent stress response
MSKQKKDPKQPELPQGLKPESELPPDADLEERFNDFWKQNGTGIFGGIAVGAVIVVGIQLFQYMGVRKEQSIRDAFAAAGDTAAKIEFADEYPDHPLAGLAQLQIADMRYEDESFSEAADSYAAAARSFEDPTLVSRALLGQGMSLLRAGQMESGRAILEAIAFDNSALDQTRGEAAFHLAVSYWEEGDHQSAHETIDVILSIDSPFWSYRGNLLKERLDPVSVAAAGS